MASDNKYQAGKIYKITDMAYTECYVGSTVQPLCKRMAWHRRDYQQHKRDKTKFVSSYALFDKYGIENCKIELIEDFPCESKEQLSKREGHHIRNEVCVNKCIAGRSDLDYRHDNKDKKKDYDVKYRQENKERKQCVDKAFYEANKERLKEIKRERYHHEASVMKQRSKAYYEANKERLKEKRLQRLHRNNAEGQPTLP